MESVKPLPTLNAAELRVLGSLMEKSRTTPDYYPMTINALTAACNQKSSRNPVVNYDEETVIQTLNTLKIKGLVSTATGGTSRVTKYKHNLALIYPLTPDEVAVICLLLLRGPQTPGEINTNAGRMYEFESFEEVLKVLDKLSSGEPAFVMQLPRRQGQKEMRFMHLLGGPPNVNDYDEQETTQSSNAGDLEARLSKVENELAELKKAFNNLMKELNG